MRTQETRATTTEASFCAYCGHPMPAGQPRIERFGQRFCSEAHAEDFAAGVRNARMLQVAAMPPATTACSIPPAGQRTWRDYLKRGACWGAPLLLLLAVPLFWSGNAVAASGGSLLSVLALLACPLGMYFMMRGMGSMNHHSEQSERRDEDTAPTRSWRRKGGG